MQRIELRRDVRIGDGEPRDMLFVHLRRVLATVGPFLALDASLSPTIARKFLPRLEVFEIEARRNAHVTQVSDTPFSRFKLIASPGASEAAKLTAENTLRDVRHFAEEVVARIRKRHGPGARVLLVTYLEIAERLRQAPIDGVDIAHFGALRGLDVYKDHAAVIIVGRQEPSLGSSFDKAGIYRPGVEDMARALFGDEDEPLATMTPEAWRVAHETRGFRIRDGGRAGARVRCHRDPRVQALVEQVREQETVQALDRLRLVHREVPAEVFILSNIVLPVTVDRLVKWRELRPSRLAIVAVRLDGVLPLVPAWLAQRFPDLGETPKAAEHELRRAAQNPQTPIGTSILESGGFRTALYRAVGAGPRPSRALIRADHPAPEVALADLVGRLAMFRWEEPQAADFADPRTWGLDDPRPADVVPLMGACSRCGDQTPPGVAVCAGCAWLDERAPEPTTAAQPPTDPPVAA